MDFNEKAKSWDNPKKINMGNKIAKIINSKIDIMKYENALEFGAGTGILTFALLDNLKKVLLIDISDEMLKIALEKAKIINTNKITTKCIDINKNLLSNKYDLIYTMMALHHVENIEQTLNNLINMQDNGAIIIIDLELGSESFHNNIENFKGHHGIDRNLLESFFIKNNYQILFNDTINIIKKNSSEVKQFMFIATN